MHKKIRILENQNSIFVEGCYDAIFISCFIEKMYDGSNSPKFESIPIGGNHTRLDAFRNAFKETHNKGGRNLIILDADKNEAEKRQFVEKFGESLQLSIPLFLMPNNADEGDLEDLLLKCTVESHACLLDCFDDYVRCLPKDKNYIVPGKKAKVYAYAEAFEQGKKRNYLSTTEWNIMNDFTEPLKLFLNNNLYVQ